VLDGSGGLSKIPAIPILMRAKLNHHRNGVRKATYRVSHADEAVDINRDGRTFFGLVLWLLTSNHFDDDGCWVV
jgi:hypothetical protein